MDYTDLATVKSYMDSVETGKDSVLSAFITRASRYLDRLTVGIEATGVDDYFKQETITDEVLTNGVIGNGLLTFWPHKPVIQSVAALSYRCRLSDVWTAADTNLISVESDAVVFEGWLLYSERVYVKVTYQGGLGTTIATLPGDLVDLATLLTVRLYKEARSGLGDAIGVAELSTMIYTKAFPVRVRDTLEKYQRTNPWT